VEGTKGEVEIGKKGAAQLKMDGGKGQNGGKRGYGGIGPSGQMTPPAAAHRRGQFVRKDGGNVGGQILLAAMAKWWGGIEIR
jgi:hypothetical protein